MHIKFIVNSFPNASETFLFNLVTGLESKGCKVSVCATSTNNNINLYETRLHEWSGNIEHIPMQTSLFFKLFEIAKICALNPKLAISCFSKYGIKRGGSNLIKVYYLLKNKPDIIHFAYSGIGVNFLDAIKLLKLYNKIIFVSCRGSAEKIKPLTDINRKLSLMNLFVYVDRVHCVSKDMLNGLLKYGLLEDKAFVNYPSINIDTFKRNIPYNVENKITWEFVTTGRLHYQKGYPYFLQALKNLKEKGLRFRYSIIGDGPDRQLITYLIHEFDLENNVILYGKVNSDSVKDILGKADIFILPSLYEGVANAALEAMAMGVPVVTTTAGGMREAIIPRVNGMIVNRFSPSDLESAIEELTSSMQLRQIISFNSIRCIAEKFSTEKQINIFIHEYENTLNHSKHTSAKLDDAYRKIYE